MSYQLIYRTLAKWLVFANVPGDLGSNPRWSHTKDSKMVPGGSLLNTQYYKVLVIYIEIFRVVVLARVLRSE